MSEALREKGSRGHRRRPWARVLALLVLEMVCVAVTVVCGPLHGVPRWVVSLAFVLACAVVPLAIGHTLLGE